MSAVAEADLETDVVTEVCTDFTRFAKPVCKRFEEMSKRELYVADVGDVQFEKYLAAFPVGTNPVFRERTVHNCVLPGAWIHGRVMEASKARYSGEAVELVTKSGQRLSLTVNHPVLTSQGFIPAGDLHKGHQVLKYGGHHDPSGIAAHDQHPPAMIEEIFESFEVSSSTSWAKAATSLDLYGDGKSIHGEISVVRPNSLLWRHPHSKVTSRLNDSQVAGGSMGHQFLPDESALDASSHAVLLATTSSVGVGDTPLPLISSHGPVPSDHGVGGSASRDASVLELVQDGGSAHADGTGDARGVFTTNVPIQDLLNHSAGDSTLRFGNGSELNIRRYQPSSDGGLRESDVRGDLLQRFAGKVSLDDVVEVRRFHYDGPVYDLGTDVGYFAASSNSIHGGMIVSNCQCCKRYVKWIGRLVAIENGKVVTVWGGRNLPYPYNVVAEAMDAAVRAAPIKTVFRSKERKFGEDHNYDPKTNARYNHFHGVVADRHFAADPETKRGEQEAIFQVAKRGLNEIEYGDLEAVLDLINSNGLYRGEEHKPAVQGFLQLKHDFAVAGGLDRFVWENLDNRNARFRNTVIGTLLTDMAEGKDIEVAVKAFEVKVAPANYKRPTSIITQKMTEAAIQTMTDLGLHGAIARRYARLSDISVNDVLFVDNKSRSKMKDGMAALLESSIKRSAPDVSKAVKMTAEEFVRDVLPTAKSLEAFVENRHAGNFVSLTTSDSPERLFKWNNSTAWSYDGDVADSVKQRVKAAGGKIDCLLRVSLSWYNIDDLDLHAKIPGGSEVYYASKQGILDVDMNAGHLVRNPVENLAFNTLKDGVYQVWVNQFNRRETVDFGFAIEVEFGGIVHQYSYSKALKSKEDVPCFKLHVKGGSPAKIETDLVGGATSQDKWGVKTETLVPVAAVCHSPNHWNDSAIGAKHLILALKGCKNPGSTRGLFNEYLRGDLDKHRKVFEVLANKTKAAYSDEQVSGVGFTSARGDTVTVVVDGKRAYQLSF